MSASPTIVLITALEVELAAMRALLEFPEEVHRGPAGRERPYTIGTIPAAGGGDHHVALSLAGTGTNIAAARAAQARADFETSLRYLFMVGIAAGVPDPTDAEHHVRLGDVVISDKLIQHDLVARTADGIEHRVPPRPASSRLLDRAKLLRAGVLRGERLGTPLPRGGVPEHAEMAVSSPRPQLTMSWEQRRQR